ncbi:DUF4402 domain-containing protein [Desulfobotulus sp.]|uniref:DUF4402 domain-containing protein n=1 Tax=Desulfobotulus sp. TaxID=1940337 RepID=UPI002A3651B8|nr:DUF4402 domain-containing protein [Desulfobotulus sp.]MDY0163242.1 DUF4402 domain-containing protein [Desulfobotulus sp.]
MKKKFAVCLTALMACALFGAEHTKAASVNMTAEATIESAVLSGSQDQSLNFGTIVAAGSAATVTIDASGGGGVLPAVTAGTASVSGGHNGRINVTTTLDANINITYPGSILITITGGGAQTMTINNIAANSTASPMAITTAGPNKIFVGGALQVGAGQVVGTYRNTLVPITFIYE